MKNSSFAVLCYLRSNRLNKQGKAQIYMRITVNGQRSEFSLKNAVKPKQWCSKKGRVKGTSALAKSINELIDSFTINAHKVHTRFTKKKRLFTAETIKNKMLSKGREQKMLIAVYEEHNQQIKRMVGIDYSYITFRRHVRTRMHLATFLEKEYCLSDISLKLVDLQFITKFHDFLKSKRIGSQNTITKYVVDFKKIIRLAFANGWVSKDPFYHWKAKWQKVERDVLTEADLEKLIKTKIKSRRLDCVKDVFIFACFTGLAYIDVEKLSKKHLKKGTDGSTWIKINRSKTSIKSTVPLLPIPERILKKYKYLKDSKKLLPVVSNQKTNEYLKEIAILCGIEKKLTFHLARHTFATTVTLSNGVPIESVSKMLGHSSLRTTQIYAKVIDRKLGEDMAALKSRYAL